MTTCDSSLLKAYEWDANSWTLTVVFRSNNSVRAYAEVPPEVFSEMESAKSIGSFYNQNIKGKFESLKIDAVTDEEIAEAVAETSSPTPVEAKPRISDEEYLGITDEDIRAVDPEYVDPRSIKAVHAPGTWHGVPLPPGTEEKAAEVILPAEQEALAEPEKKRGELELMVAESSALIPLVPTQVVVIRDKAHYMEVAEVLKQKVNARDRLFKFLDPMRDAVYKAYTAVQSRQKTVLDPMDASIKADKQALLTWDEKERQKAVEAQRKAQREAEEAAAIEQQRRTEELRMQVAQEQAEAGDTEQSEASLFDESIVAAPVPVYVPRMVVDTPVVDGFSGRKNWKIQEVTDFDALILDVAEGIRHNREKGNLAGHAPSTMLLPNMPSLNKRAKSDERINLFPGVIAFNDRGLNVKKG
jgi:hypothetical protein